MTKKEALKFQQIIEQKCKEKGVWYDVKHGNRPELKDITVVITLKVTDND